MANYVKPGLVYYPSFTNRYMDIRMKKLKRNKDGCIGLAVFDYILCEIYRVQGYYIVWDEDTIFEIASYLDLKVNTVKEVVNYCCHLGLFNKELKANESILTSLEIQEQYIFICKQSRRKVRELDVKYNLITPARMDEFEENFQENEPESFGVFNTNEKYQKIENSEDLPENSEDLTKNSEDLPENSEDLKQRKEKKSKENIFSSFPSFFDELIPGFRPAFEMWINYKESRGEPYKKLSSLKGCYTRLINESGNNPEVAYEMIQMAKDNNWAGFFPKKQGGAKSVKKINIEFDEFWELYDKKTADKAKCKAKWEKLTDSERSEAIIYIPKYKEAQPDKSFRKNPDTFINQHGWTHELVYSKNTSRKNHPATNYKQEGGKDDRF